MKRLVTCIFMLLLSASCQAHFTHFEPRIIHISQEGNDVILQMRMPLPLVLLDETWGGIDSEQPVIFTQKIQRGEQLDYRVDAYQIREQFEQLSQRIKSGYRISVNGAKRDYQVEAINLFNSDSRRPFSSLQDARDNFSGKIQISDDVSSLFDAGIDIQIRVAATSLTQDDLQIFSGLGEKFNAINRLANIINLYREGNRESVTTVGVLEFSSTHLPPMLQKLAEGFYNGLIHILIGLDHVVFVLLIFFSANSIVKLISLATAFTVGHSFSLVFGENLAITTPLFTPGIELLIALSICATAIALLIDKGRHLGSTPMLIIGIIHGFGFSFVFSEIAKEGASQGLSSILAFTAGIEAGQLLVYVFAFCFAYLVHNYIKPARPVAYYVSVAALLISGYWVVTRSMPLLEYALV